MSNSRPNDVRFRWSSQPNSSSFPSSESAEVIESVFSSKLEKPVTFRPEEPLPSQVQELLDSAIHLIECATGGHGRCTEGTCGCQCHE
jgi:hypothetical protein